ARELIPGPVATTALATLVVADPALLGALAAGQLTAGAALTGDLHEDSGVISGTADVLGADASGLVLLPVGDHVVSVDVTANPGVTIEPLEATDFSRTLSRVTLDRAPATRLAVTRRRFTDLAAALLAAESAGVARWTLDTAADYAKVREQFGKPIGSFQAVKHLCAEMLLRCQQSAVAAADAAVALAGDDEGQSSVASAVAAAAGIAAATANAKDCIQVLGGIGITWEHDAHLYLRRAYGIAQFLGGRAQWLRRVTDLTLDGVRRDLHIDLDSVAHLQPEIAAAAAAIAALPAAERQAAMADSGLLAPHWPAPYGRTSAAHRAQWGVCLARTNSDAPKHRGITYFLLDMKSPGITIRPLREITGARNFNEVFLDDVFIPDEMVVGSVDDGWRLARTTLANERVAMAQGTALGNPMEEMLRGLAGAELDPATSDRLGELLLAAQVGSLLDQRIARLAVGGRDTSAEASARKLIGVRYRQALEEFRMDHSPGGGAVINEAVHSFLNTRCLSIAGGTEQILLSMAGERLLGLPR
ncbi:MAG: hypothetical protein EBU54_06350, partial [Mycobacteriaceae bacterium]|nr:hypothetical protein [Mycobacteriaceae bacterium]